MIESRYTIEYVDPNPEKTSSKVGRFFIYSTLTLSISAAVVALIFSNLPTKTTQMITAKVQKFISDYNQPSSPVSLMSQKAITSDEESPIVSAKATKKPEISVKDKSKKLEEEYKKEIDRLSQENITQHDATAKQASTNQALTKKLDLLSKQLSDERQKSGLLTQEVTSLQTKNKSISALLAQTEEAAKKQAIEAKALTKKKIEVTTQAVAEKTKRPVVEKIEPAVKEKEIASVELVESIEAPAEILKEVVPLVSPMANTKKKATSQIDAIMATMKAATSTSKVSNKQEPNARVSSIKE